MIIKRNSENRGHVRLDWLDSKHSFSFGSYYDPEHMGFRALRVINEDKVKEHPFEQELLQRSFYSDGAVGDW